MSLLPVPLPLPAPGHDSPLPGPGHDGLLPGPGHDGPLPGPRDGPQGPADAEDLLVRLDPAHCVGNNTTLQ